MNAIVGSYSSLSTLTLSGRVGEYAVRRTINSEPRLFLIYFLRDEDGVWRLAAM